MRLPPALPALVLGAALAAAPAHAQGPDTSGVPPSADGPVRVRIVRSPFQGAAPLRPGEAFAPLIAEPEPEPPASRRPAPPLTPGQLQRVRSAQAFRETGQLDQARKVLRGLLSESPHHPAFVTEMVRVLNARGDHGGAARLARSEREAAHDSLLASREAVYAYERQGRPREAARVALETLLAGPGRPEWARATVLRLAPADPKGVGELVRRTAAMARGRIDVARLSARLDWAGGDASAAMATLAAADLPGPPPGLRWSFAEDLLRAGTARDSSGAIAALASLAGDRRFQPALRLGSARRALEVAAARGTTAEAAPGLSAGLGDLPRDAWGADLVLAISRGLRAAGRTDDARTLLQSAGPAGAAIPEIEIEQALADLRDGPPARALPRLRAVAEQGSAEGAFQYAEALFFAGESDSALAWYQRVATDPAGARTGASLERIYLIEDGEPRSALATLGRIAWERWRSEPGRAAAAAETLLASLPQGPLWAQAALMLSEARERLGDFPGALAPMLALADSLPDDRLAPLARQRAGDLYLDRLQDPRQALVQYEECLARYPRAWNAPEVRRRLEQLRRDRRF